MLQSESSASQCLETVTEARQGLSNCHFATQRGCTKLMLARTVCCKLVVFFFAMHMLTCLRSLLACESLEQQQQLRVKPTHAASQLHVHVLGGCCCCMPFVTVQTCTQVVACKRASPSRSRSGSSTWAVVRNENDMTQASGAFGHCCLARCCSTRHPSAMQQFCSQAPLGPNSQSSKRR